MLKQGLALQVMSEETTAKRKEQESYQCNDR